MFLPAGFSPPGRHAAVYTLCRILLTSVLARVLANAYNTPLVACSLAVVAWSIYSWTLITLPCDFYTKTALVF